MTCRPRSKSVVTRSWSDAKAFPALFRRMRVAGSRKLLLAISTMDLSLPLDYSVIRQILPHRYPFLLVDRITEFQAGQADRRYQERYAERAAP